MDGKPEETVAGKPGETAEEVMDGMRRTEEMTRPVTRLLQEHAGSRPERLPVA